MADPKPDAAAPEERRVQTHHHLEVEGERLAYTATLSTIHLKGPAGADRASVFSAAFTLDGVEDPASRPVTFCFNGGPGSSSVWLHLGALGPKRAELPDGVAPPPPPYRLVDNPDSILDRSDLVFVDPVGTGFSLPLGETEPKDFYSVQGDAEAMAEFIQRWLTREGRWNSPKLLAGESYGTTRAAAVAGVLHERGIFLNGLALLSLALDFQTFVDEPGNDLPFLLYLPSYVAVAWYHGRLTEAGPLEPLLERARRFAFETYAPALLLGDRLPEPRRVELAAELARLTGLPADEIARRRLRIAPMWFARTLLGPGERTVGRLDGRFVGPDTDPVASEATRDPSYDGPLGPYAALVNDYLRRSLGWTGDAPYVVFSVKVNEAWSWEREKRMGYPDVRGDLRGALNANPHLKILVASGYFDLATPFFGTEYTVDHLGVDAERRANLSLSYYRAGHMMYLHPASRAKLRADLVDLYRAATAR